MCGIAGYIDFSYSTSSDTIYKMVQTLHHRGPDYMGYEHFNLLDACVGFGHARLSIIDLSPAGHQPMKYNDLVIVYNGEIYNFKEIREDLEKCGHQFISNSDTEVILHSYEKWGPGFVKRLIGMFVIAILDKSNYKLLIFRDRAGIKPVFYYWHKRLFLFASELKAICIHPDFTKEMDNNSVSSFFDFGYIPAPSSIFRNTYKIEPGSYLVLDIRKEKIFHHKYWDVHDYYCLPKFEYDYNEAKAKVRNLLISSCNYRMIADVPIGIFLSGGYDSTLVTAILQKDRTERIKTFTIGFEEGNNEAPFAEEVARYLGTDHTQYICTTKEAQEIIPDLPYYYDEPFADSSAIPTMLVSKLARSSVKVALSADAGDELFAGYTDYQKFQNYLKTFNRIPGEFNTVLRPFLSLLSDLTPKSKPSLKNKLSIFAKSLNKNKIVQAIEVRRRTSCLPELYRTKMFKEPLKGHLTNYNRDFSRFTEILEIALAIDYEMYLQNDILTKVDRASMSVSLESREPLLDHRLTEFVFQLPIEFKFNRNGGKRILKEIVHEYIPSKLVNRPKAGFTLPIYKWLTGDLSYLIEDYLNKNSISKSDLFNSDFVSKQVDLFRNNRFYYKPVIWKLLMFQMWYHRWIA